jgi:hypothetical protein
VTELKELALEHNISGISSKMNKAELKARIMTILKFRFERTKNEQKEQIVQSGDDSTSSSQVQ